MKNDLKDILEPSKILVSVLFRDAAIGWKHYYEREYKIFDTYIKIYSDFYDTIIPLTSIILIEEPKGDRNDIK